MAVSRASLSSLIAYPLISLIILSAVFGSTLISSLAVKKIEERDHKRIEALEETIVEFLGREREKIYDQVYLTFLKEKINFEISLYNQEGAVVFSTTDLNSLLMKNAFLEAGVANDLSRKKISHIHKHFSIGNDHFMTSYYLFPAQDNEPPSILSLTSPLGNFYGLRNQISLIIGLGIISMLGLVAVFLAFFLRGYIIRPIKKIITTIQKIKEGDINVSVPEISHGEVGDLAESFSLMINKLREAREKEEEVSRMKTEILSVAAHHLRTPLSAMKWSLRMLLDEEVGKIILKEQKDLLEKTYDSNEQMIALIDDLLDVSKIEEGRFGYSWSYEQMEDVVLAAVGEFMSRAKQLKINLVYLKAKELLPKVKMDPAKLRLALNNLIDNAIKYSVSEGEVKISLEYKKSDVVFSIEDAGIGIPQSEQVKMFSKFFRASNAMLFQSKGTGLGLFIAKSIVEKHGGRLWFKSEEDKGSTFYFSLPIEKQFIPKERFAEFLEGV